MSMFGQRGAAPLLLLIAMIGIVAFMVVAATAPFRESVLTLIYPKSASHAAGSVSLSMATSASTINPGQTFTVNVNIDSGIDAVSAVDLQVNFDAQVLKANSISSSGLLSTELVPGAISGNSATITLGANPGTAKAIDGTLVAISFTALQTTSGPTAITFNSGTQIAVLGMSGNQVGSMTPLNINVVAVATPTPVPTPTPTPIPTPTKTPVPTPTPTPTNNASIIKIYAAGTPAKGVYPSMRLQIKSPSGTWSTIRTWSDVRGDAGTRNFQEFVYNHTSKITPDRVRVRFINDASDKSGQDRNLIVDRINLDGIDIQTERDTTYSQGSWTQDAKCRAGFKKSEWLHCNGFFEYQ